MSFQIEGLPVATFAPLFGLSDAQLSACAAARVTADQYPGFPCRVSLRDAPTGENLILVNYEHLAVSSPYRSRHAIFVRENASEAHLEIDEVPEMLLMRLLSLRAFDAEGMMTDADVIHGCKLAISIKRMLQSDRVQYLHIHNAKQGCFAARANRACA